MAEVRRLLVRAPNWVGDVVLSLPALRDLRRAFPTARVSVLARPWVADLYGAVPEVDEVIPSHGLRADMDRVRNGFEAAVLLPNSFGVALVAWGARIPERWGFATEGRGLLLTRAPRVPAAVRGRSQVYYYRAMLEGLGFDTTRPPDASLVCPEDWRARGRALLGADGPWLGLNPGAFFGTAKRWLPERYGAVGDLVSRRVGARVVLIGGKAERGLADQIAAGMAAKPRVLTGETSLPELLGVLSCLDGFVTNDSGPMHLAAALGVRQVAVFGSTDWRETAPFTERATLVREPVACAPCMLRECPIDHRCMRGVTVERVTEAALELLPLKPAIFMDRDGTLSHEVGYVNQLSRFRLLPWTVDAVRLINRSGWLAVVVTNQAGVARGYFPESLIHEVHASLRASLQAGDAHLDGLYFCPHHPTVGEPPYLQDCDCRKPRPGMLHRAKAELGIDLERSWVVGDRMGDLELAWKVGARGALVKTGYGLGELAYDVPRARRAPDLVAEHLLQAVLHIVGGDAERADSAEVRS